MRSGIIPMLKGLAASNTDPKVHDAAVKASGPGRVAAKGGSLLVLMALFAFALTLRSPITAISPVIGEIRSDLGINAAMAGLLTSIPVLCFGVLTPFASVFIARTSIEVSIFATLIGAALGMLVRSAGGFEVALVGTVILGASLTIGNIVSLMVIARDFLHRSSTVTGIYTAALNVGTMLTSALTAPMALRFGWRLALASWITLSIVAALLWFFAVLQRRKVETGLELMDETLHSASKKEARVTQPQTDLVPVWRRPLVWLLIVAFSTHIFIYNGMSAWLPTYFVHAAGMDITASGYAASAFQILALAGSFGIPALAKRFPRPTLLLAMAVTWLITQLGLLAAPSLWLLWSIVGGIATGGAFTAVFMLIMENTVNLDDNRKVSSVVQGGGYTFAALGPLAVGSLHQASGTWTAAFLLLSALSMVMIVAAIGVIAITRHQRLRKVKGV